MDDQIDGNIPGAATAGFLIYIAGPWIVAYAVALFFSKGRLRTALEIFGFFCICSAGALLYWRSQWLKDMPDHSIINDPAKTPALSSVIIAIVAMCFVAAIQAILIAKTKQKWRWWCLGLSVPLVAFLFQYVDQAQEMYGVFTGGRL